MYCRFAVVGNPIAHSLSPVIHQCFAKQTNVLLIYEKILADKQFFELQVTDFFSQGGKGLNITLPFKERAFALAQRSTARAQLAGAANTLWMNDRQLQADNTDGVGLIRDLTRYLTLQGIRILVLGAGGAARGMMHPLLENNPAALVVAVRNVAKAADFQVDFPQIRCVHFNNIAEEFDLVINATSASLAGEFVSLPRECMSQKTLCYDLAYKQQGSTVFVQYARDLGCTAVDGLGMLVEQAAEAFYIWHGIRPSTQEVLAFLR